MSKRIFAKIRFAEKHPNVFFQKYDLLKNVQTYFFKNTFCRKTSKRIFSKIRFAEKHPNAFLEKYDLQKNNQTHFVKNAIRAKTFKRIFEKIQSVSKLHHGAKRIFCILQKKCNFSARIFFALFLAFFSHFFSKMRKNAKKYEKKCEKNAHEHLGVHSHFSKNAIALFVCNFDKSHFSKNANALFVCNFDKLHFLENAKFTDKRILNFFEVRIRDGAQPRQQFREQSISHFTPELLLGLNFLRIVSPEPIWQAVYPTKPDSILLQRV